MHGKYDVKIKQEILQQYVKGKKIVELSNIYNIRARTIQRWTSQAYPEKKKKCTKIDISTKKKALEMHKNGMSSVDIAKQIGCCNATVDIWVKKYGTPFHRGPKSKIKREDFFDEINSEEKAYFLGWLMADGCVSITNNQYCLKIHIQERDRELVDNFLKALQSTYVPVIKKNNKGTNSIYVSLTSKHMCMALIKLGVIPNKTGKECVPNISKSLLPHFFRGYFDGDGITNYSNTHKRSGFIGTQDVLTKIQQIIGTNQKMYHPSNTKENTKIYYFLWGKKNSTKFYCYIYNNATIWLKRKRHKMDLICGNTEVTEDSNIFSAP